ncbi:MAG: sigma factor-like helix-turn-helix DNA-binding protein [Dehalococcoidia bacterium]
MPGPTEAGIRRPGRGLGRGSACTPVPDRRTAQRAIVLRFFEGLSVAEVARVTQRREGAVKALQHRACGECVRF